MEAPLRCQEVGDPVDDGAGAVRPGDSSRGRGGFPPARRLDSATAAAEREDAAVLVEDGVVDPGGLVLPRGGGPAKNKFDPVGNRRESARSWMRPGTKDTAPDSRSTTRHWLSVAMLTRWWSMAILAPGRKHPASTLPRVLPAMSSKTSLTVAWFLPPATAATTSGATCRDAWAATKARSVRRDRHDLQTARRRQSGLAGTRIRMSCIRSLGRTPSKAIVAAGVSNGAGAMLNNPWRPAWLWYGSDHLISASEASPSPQLAGGQAMVKLVVDAGPPSLHQQQLLASPSLFLINSQPSSPLPISLLLVIETVTLSDLHRIRQKTSFFWSKCPLLFPSSTDLMLRLRR